MTMLIQNGGGVISGACPRLRVGFEGKYRLPYLEVPRK